MTRAGKVAWFWAFVEHNRFTSYVDKHDKTPCS